MKGGFHREKDLEDLGRSLQFEERNIRGTLREDLEKRDERIKVYEIPLRGLFYFTGEDAIC